MPLCQGVAGSRRKELQKERALPLDLLLCNAGSGFRKRSKCIHRPSYRSVSLCTTGTPSTGGSEGPGVTRLLPVVQHHAHLSKDLLKPTPHHHIVPTSTRRRGHPGGYTHLERPAPRRAQRPGQPYTPCRAPTHTWQSAAAQRQGTQRPGTQLRRRRLAPGRSEPSRAAARTVQWKTHIFRLGDASRAQGLEVALPSLFFSSSSPTGRHHHRKLSIRSAPQTLALF